MSLTKLIEKLRDQKRNSGLIINSDLLALCCAAELMREAIGLISEGEGDSEQVYMTMARTAINRADEICKDSK